MKFLTLIPNFRPASKAWRKKKSRMTCSKTHTLTLKTTWKINMVLQEIKKDSVLTNNLYVCNMMINFTYTISQL